MGIYLAVSNNIGLSAVVPDVMCWCYSNGFPSRMLTIPITSVMSIMPSWLMSASSMWKSGTGLARISPRHGSEGNAAVSIPDETLVFVPRIVEHIDDAHYFPVSGNRALRSHHH